MIELFFCEPRVIARFRNISLHDGFDELATYLHKRGQALVSAQDYLRGAAHFGFWIDVEGLSLAKVTDEVVARFLQEHLPKCQCPIPSGLPIKTLHAALGHFLRVLRESRRIPVHTAPSQTPTDIVLQEFHQFLRHVQGTTESTCGQYTRYVRKFLIAKFGVDSINISGLVPGEVIRFVEESSMHWRPKTTKLLCSSLRCFLRFVQLNGLCDGRLASAVPTIPGRKLSHVPKTLSDAQLQALLSSFDRHSPIGRRDFAIALCLCRLALRSCEVAQLRLDDIDWRSGTVRIRGKSRRTSVLPLPPDVGRAIVDYLRHGRPSTDERSVFVRHQLPVGTQIVAYSVRAAIRSAFERENIRVPSKGTHVLRHTAATNMVRAGASLKEVADVLRHRSINTTAIYTKVDLPRLAAVAMPWPEVRP